MRKLTVTEFVSLDGVMEAPKWTTPYWCDELAKFKYAELMAGGALLLGRKTYENYARAWPARAGVDGYADRMNSIPKHVVSSTLTRLDWNNSTVIREDIAAAIGQLKTQPGGDILVFGSGTLVVYLIQQDLVDEYHLLIYPLVLGHGQRLFPTGSSVNLQRVASQSFHSGVMALVYQST
ncbi:MAG: dihydrofolate reductase family protein [Caldilineaceae bacterium]